MTWQNLMQGVFIPLMVFSVWSAAVLWRRVAIPAWRDRSVARYVMGVGGTFISTGVAIECLLYGLVRWVPSAAWLSNVYPVAVLPKMLYIVGMVLILACAVSEPERETRVRRLLWLAFSLLLVGFLLAAVED